MLLPLSSAFLELREEFHQNCRVILLNILVLGQIVRIIQFKFNLFEMFVRRISPTCWSTQTCHGNSAQFELDLSFDLHVGGQLVLGHHLARQPDVDHILGGVLQ